MHSKAYLQARGAKTSGFYISLICTSHGTVATVTDIGPGNIDGVVVGARLNDDSFSMLAMLVSSDAGKGTRIGMAGIPVDALSVPVTEDAGMLLDAARSTCSQARRSQEGSASPPHGLTTSTAPVVKLSMYLHVDTAKGKSRLKPRIVPIAVDQTTTVNGLRGLLFIHVTEIAALSSCTLEAI